MYMSSRKNLDCTLMHIHSLAKSLGPRDKLQKNYNFLLINVLLDYKIYICDKFNNKEYIFDIK